MIKNFLTTTILALTSENFINVGEIVNNAKNISFAKSKNRPFTKGKRQKSLKERSNRRKAKRNSKKKG